MQSGDLELHLFQETKENAFYDQFRGQEWLGSIRIAKSIWDDRLIEEKCTGHFFYYERYDRHGHHANSFMKLKEPLWFSKPAHLIFEEEVGIDLDRETAERLVDIFDGTEENQETSLDAYFYVSALKDCLNGNIDAVKEAIKWIFGSIAAAKKLTNKSTADTCPARVLGKFTEYLVGDKFPKHHAREIFDLVLQACPMYLDNTIIETLDGIIADPKFVAISTGVIEQAVSTTLAGLPDKVIEVKTNPKLIQWFVGQVLRAHKGLNPAEVKAELESQLGLLAA